MKNKTSLPFFKHDSSPWKINTKVLIAVFCAFCLFLFTHLTPEISARAQLFFWGYPQKAFTVQLVETNHTKNTWDYTLTPTIESSGHKGYATLYDITVKKNLIFYFTSINFKN